ncbi:MAG: hypothetical protein IIA61_10325 [Candidatus Marinimicrobia bacterium]|nr:hypothetical protein [Candidatus Neomarinimicrobiota bacterium]
MTFVTYSEIPCLTAGRQYSKIDEISPSGFYGSGFYTFLSLNYYYPEKTKALILNLTLHQ